MTSTLESSKIIQLQGRALPLQGNDIDTDRVIPARFMKCVTFDELGQYLFYDVRFNEDGSKKNHPLNDIQYQGSSILLVQNNFGCGSSREHAPQSIKRYGFKAIIGESFAEIFADNCTAIGLPVMTASKSDLQKLVEWAEKNPSQELQINLASQKVTHGSFSISIHQSEQIKKALIEGIWDTTAELLSAADQIKNIAQKLPYQNGYSA